MEKERLLFLKRRTFQAKDTIYYVIDVLDIFDATTISVFTDKSNYDYFGNYNIMEDITPFVEFHCNNSGLYRLSIKRKE